MKHSLITLVTLLLLFSCKEKQPEKPAYLIEEEEMVALMVDMHLVETAQNLKLLGTDSLQTKYQQYFTSIFNSHGTTKADFDSSLYYYSTNTDRMNAIYDQLLEELYELESEVKSDQ